MRTYDRMINDARTAAVAYLTAKKLAAEHIVDAGCDSRIPNVRAALQTVARGDVDAEVKRAARRLVEDMFNFDEALKIARSVRAYIRH